MCQIAVNTVFSPEFPVKARSWNCRCLPRSTCVLEVSDIDVGKQMAAYTYDLLVELRDNTHRFVLLSNSNIIRKVVIIIVI